MQCRRCKQEKQEQDFNWKIKAQGLKQTVCKTCVRDQNLKYRELHGEQYSQNRRLKYRQNVERVREGRREDYAKNREKYLAENKKWREENPEKYAESSKRSREKRRHLQLEANDEYRLNKREEINAKARTKYAEAMLNPEFREKERVRSLAKNRQEKLLVIDAYGGKCTCCGEDEVLFLTIDHVNGNGNMERRNLGIQGGHAFYRFLKKAGYPPGYQVLCFNCNAGKHMNGGTCPHKTKGN